MLLRAAPQRSPNGETPRLAWPREAGGHRVHLAIDSLPCEWHIQGLKEKAYRPTSMSSTGMPELKAAPV